MRFQSTHQVVVLVEIQHRLSTNVKIVKVFLDTCSNKRVRPQTTSPPPHTTHTSTNSYPIRSQKRQYISGAPKASCQHRCTMPVVETGPVIRTALCPEY